MELFTTHSSLLSFSKLNSQTKRFNSVRELEVLGIKKIDLSPPDWRAGWYCQEQQTAEGERWLRMVWMLSLSRWRNIQVPSVKSDPRAGFRAALTLQQAEKPWQSITQERPNSKASWDG